MKIKIRRPESRSFRGARFDDIFSRVSLEVGGRVVAEPFRKAGSGIGIYTVEFDVPGDGAEQWVFSVSIQSTGDAVGFSSSVSVNSVFVNPLVFFQSGFPMYTAEFLFGCESGDVVNIVVGGGGSSGVQSSYVVTGNLRE